MVGVFSANYTRVFSDGRFGEAITTTARFAAFAVRLELGSVLALALMVAPMVGSAVLLRATDAIDQFDLVMAITGPNDRR